MRVVCVVQRGIVSVGKWNGESAFCHVHALSKRTTDANDGHQPGGLLVLMEKTSMRAETMCDFILLRISMQDGAYMKDSKRRYTIKEKKENLGHFGLKHFVTFA